MSVKSVQFAVAAHIMAALAYHHGEEISSATLAESVMSFLKIPYSPWRSHICNESKTQPACGSPESRETKFADVRVQERSFGRKFKAQDAARCSTDSEFSGSPSFVAVV
jgi:hypothetical protein